MGQNHGEIKAKVERGEIYLPAGETEVAG